MTDIFANKIINAPVDRVWEIISDLDKDPEYWHGTRSVKNIRKEENLIERETTIAFKESKCKEIITLEPKNKITIDIISGPITGKKIIELENIKNDKSKIEVKWKIQMKGIMRLFAFVVKKHILKGTRDALERISQKAETK